VFFTSQFVRPNIVLTAFFLNKRASQMKTLKVKKKKKMLKNYNAAPNLRSRGSSGSTLSDYGLDDRGSIPDNRGRGFFF
jgi:hypothetical protein